VSDAATVADKSTSSEIAKVGMVYVRDHESEGIIRQGFSNLGVTSVSYTSGGVGAAIADLSRKPSPRLLVVDVSGVDDPDVRIDELAQVSEPGTSVVVIGDVNDVRLYRNLKNSGVFEYYFKPLVSNLVTATFNSILNGGVEKTASRTGKLVFVISVRGGSGATTLATWSAWYFAEIRRRKVLLIDLDLHGGDAALQLDAVPTHALREAIEHPERVDDLFLERAIVRVTERLGILASLEPLDEVIPWKDDVVLSLLSNLLNRFRFVFVDMPASITAELMRVLHLPSMCILVSDASLVSARDLSRWRDKLAANSAERTTIHVLNKSTGHGGLPMEEFIRVAGKAPDVIMPYDRNIVLASTLGIKRYSTSEAISRAIGPVLKIIAGEAVEERRPFISRLFG
jgi:pilus assembly protein CpaE